jgi:hypothetical protein
MPSTIVQLELALPLAHRQRPRGLPFLVQEMAAVQLRSAGAAGQTNGTGRVATLPHSITAIADMNFVIVPLY